MDVPSRLSRSRPIQIARQLLLEERYGEMFEVLDGLAGATETEMASAVLRARAMILLDRPADAHALLEACDDRSGADEGAEVLMLKGAALHRLGRKSEAWGALHRARSIGARAQREIAAEASFHIAQAFWREERLEDAERALEEALAAHVELVHADALALRGTIAMQRERHAEAVGFFHEAMRERNARDRNDDAMRANLVQALCAIAYDTGDAELALSMRVEIAALPPAASAPARVHLGLAALGRGAFERAWDDLTAASRSPRSIDVVRAALGLASLAAIRSDRFSQTRHFALACEVSAGIAYTGVPLAERMVLLELATMAARIGDMERAVAALALFERLDERERPTWLDRRIDAMRWHAMGLIAACDGRRDEAIVLLEQSSVGWYAIGCMHRGDLVAGERSRIADRVAPAKLTQAERRVMIAICKGMRAREIADAFGKSENTIKNQTRRLFARMGVRNRAELVAKAVALELVDAAQ